jgi:hypothetical protein
MTDPLTTAQNDTIAGLLAEHGPGTSYTAERDEDYDAFVFAAFYAADVHLLQEKVIEADGIYDD